MVRNDEAKRRIFEICDASNFKIVVTEKIKSLKIKQNVLTGCPRLRKKFKADYHFRIFTVRHYYWSSMLILRLTSFTRLDSSCHAQLRINSKFKFGFCLKLLHA
jgi:hypothetical protein